MTRRDIAIEGLATLLEAVQRGMPPALGDIANVVDAFLEAARAPESAHTRALTGERTVQSNRGAVNAQEVGAMTGPERRYHRVVGTTEAARVPCEVAGCRIVFAHRHEYSPQPFSDRRVDQDPSPR